MNHRPALTLLLSACLAALPAAAVASDHGVDFTPGAPGVGDPYFPLAGNGGYDVEHYDLVVAYDPGTDELDGRAVIRATATQDLSQFNLDLSGLEVGSVSVNRRPADWTRDGDELVVTPRRGLVDGRSFTVDVRYSGVPETLGDQELGTSGFIHTDDGALVVGQPEVAATWFPVNDHPSDKASYTFSIRVPEGLQAVSNGELRSSRTARGWTTWTWRAREPMAPYLAMMAIGEFDVRAYREDGIRFWDAVDPDLYTPVATPRTGDQYAWSQQAGPSYKRLARTIDVPADGAEVSFWVLRDTEPGWDHLVVEARPAGSQEWTTLPDLNDHTSPDTGFVCPYWLAIHPFLQHYQSVADDGESCTPTGSSGEWWSATGASDGYEQWSVDLGGFAPGPVEVAISYVSDDIVQLNGVFVDDITVSTGEGTTSFEDDGDTFDGWTVPGAPEGSPENQNDWTAITIEGNPPSTGQVVDASFARQGEVIAFLEDHFGPYPFSTAGGVVDDEESIFFALETQTRPIYSRHFFGDQVSGDAVVVHELAHQWFGDSLALQRWQDIWLNEGFATYAEWLWSESEGLGTTQETFDGWYSIPADDPFWELPIGDPGPDRLFDIAVYQRGAMTLHALRLEVGDEDFARILRRWADSEAGGYVTTEEFVALAEQVSGQQLDELFEEWLFLPARPGADLDSARVLTRSESIAPDPRDRAIALSVCRGRPSSASGVVC